MLISYAPNFEDVVLWRALGDVDQGRYIEVGAGESGSATRLFYDRGWRGLGVAASESAFSRLTEARPDDAVWPPAPVQPPGEGAGLGRHLAEHFNGPVHFLKIDAVSEELLEALDLSVNRPWVLVLGDGAEAGEAVGRRAWERRVLDAAYRFCLFDGVNRFYVAQEHADRFAKLAVPANARDGFRVAPHSEFAVRAPAPEDSQAHDPSPPDAAGSAPEPANAQDAQALAEAERARAEAEQQRVEAEQRLVEVQRNLTLAIEAQAASERRARRLAAELGDALAEAGAVRGRLAESGGRLEVLRERYAEAEARSVAAQANLDKTVEERRRAEEALQLSAAKADALSEELKEVRERGGQSAEHLRRTLDLHVAALAAELEAAHRHMTALAAEFENARRESISLRHELVRAHDAAMEGQRSAEAQAEEKLQAELAGLAREHRLELDGLREDRRLAQRDLERHRETLQQLRASTSWRITAPLRATTTALRAGPRLALRGLIATRILTLPSRLLRRLSPGLWRRVAGPLAARAEVGLPPPPTSRPVQGSPVSPARPPAVAVFQTSAAERGSLEPRAEQNSNPAQELSSLIESYRQDRQTTPPLA